MAYEDDLYNFAAQLAAFSKEAAMGVGGQQVLPTSPYRNASGIYDPDPSRAQYSALSQLRADINASTIVDGTRPNSLAPYSSVLNEGYQTIRAGVKSASEDDYLAEVEESGLFEDVDFIPDQETWEYMKAVSQEKSASISDAQLTDMVNLGILDAVAPEIVPYFAE